VLVHGYRLPVHRVHIARAALAVEPGEDGAEEPARVAFPLELGGDAEDEQEQVVRRGESSLQRVEMGPGSPEPAAPMTT